MGGFAGRCGYATILAVGVISREIVHPVELCSALAATQLAHQQKEIPPESFGENGIEKGVCAGVDGVK